MVLSCALYVDDENIGFKGIHEDKIRISYNNEGDRFKADDPCNRGYT